MNNEPVAWMVDGEVYLLDEIDGEELNAIPLYTHPAEPKELTVLKNSQDWKGMDGATAFLLVERHSNHWDDARLMMEEWLKANTHPADLTDEEIEEVYESCIHNIVEGKFRIDFAKAILKKANEK